MDTQTFFSTGVLTNILTGSATPYILPAKKNINNRALIRTLMHDYPVDFLITP